MTQYITLMGAEDVQRAGYTIREAADSFARSVSNLEMILERHAARIEEVVTRIEEAIRFQGTSGDLSRTGPAAAGQQASA